MSDLQIALGAIGILVVGGVYVFNSWQERKLRQRLERAFGASRDDVLLQSGSAVVDSVEPEVARIEPSLGNGSDDEAITKAPWQPGLAGEIEPADNADSVIEFVADIELPVAAADAALHELQSQLSTLGKPSRMLGWDAAAQTWYLLKRNANGDCTRLQVALQLVNRAGPVLAPQLSGFCDAVQTWAARHRASVEIDDQAEALEAAQALDALCGEMDVAIGMNVVAPEGAAFPAVQVVASAIAAGLQLGDNGLFYCYDTAGLVLFTMENHDPEPFTADRLEAMQTPGLTLLLDVPQVAAGEKALAEMARVSDELAASLGGFVVDDNRVPLQAAGLARIKTQLQDIHQTMAAQKIPAGSQRARRLFA